MIRGRTCFVAPSPVLRLALLLLVLSILHTGAAELPVSQKYFNEVWQTEQGLPHNEVNAIAQTPDHYLWLGTPRGLARFDGVKFTVFTPRTHPGLSGESVIRLAHDPGGRLWIATESGGLSSYAGGAFRPPAVTSGVPLRRIQDLSSDPFGRLWTAFPNGSVEQLHGEQILLLGTPDQGTLGPATFAHDVDGPVWLATRATLGWFRRDNIWTATHTNLPPPLAIAPRRVGGVWLIAGQRLLQVQLDGRTEERATFPWPTDEINLRQLWEDRQGALWLATSRRGLLRFADGQFETVPTSHPSILSLAEDREGNLWVGTQGGGLNRIRERAFTVLDTRGGLPNDIVHSVTEDKSGQLWLVTQDGGLSVISNGVSRTLGTNDGWPKTVPLCVAPAADSGVWVGTLSEGLIRWHNGSAERLTLAHGLAGQRINALLTDRSGRLWIGYHGQGVGCLDGTNLLHFPAVDGLPACYVLAAAEDQLGRIWVGTANGGIARFTGGQVEQLQQRIHVGGIRALLPQSDGSVWAGTGSGGLVRWQQGVLTRVTTTNGLPDDSIVQLSLDENGHVWCGSPRGLFRASLRDLNAVADERLQRLPVWTVGRSDGLPDFQFANVFQPAVWRARDGRLWLASAKGAVAFAPEHLAVNREPPPVMIEAVLADGRTQPLTTVLKLPARTRDLEIQFTALNFTAPDQVRFRHRLEGRDRDWVESAQRGVHYSSLPPGSHRFQVTACHSDGLWNETGATLAFTVVPAFWQTRWFQALGAAALAGLLAAAYRVATVRRLRRRVEMLRAQNALAQERTRIAHDIHDELGASLTQIGMLAGFATKNLGQTQEVAADLEKIVATAHEAVRGMDAIVWAINPQNDSLENFSAYVSRFAEEFLRAAGLRCRFEVPPDFSSHALGSEQRHQLFLTVREALNNVVRHAEAKEVCVQLETRTDRFALTIRDDGKGLNGVAAPGSDGLANMRRRIEELGGTFAVESAPAAGTTLKMTVPLKPRDKLT